MAAGEMRDLVQSPWRINQCVFPQMAAFRIFAPPHGPVLSVPTLENWEHPSVGPFPAADWARPLLTGPARADWTSPSHYPPFVLIRGGVFVFVRFDSTFFQKNSNAKPLSTVAVQLCPCMHACYFQKKYSLNTCLIMILVTSLS